MGFIGFFVKLMYVAPLHTCALERTFRLDFVCAWAFSVMHQMTCSCVQVHPYQQRHRQQLVENDATHKIGHRNMPTDPSILESVEGAQTH